MTVVMPSGENIQMKGNFCVAFSCANEGLAGIRLTKRFVNVAYAHTFPFSISG